MVALAAMVTNAKAAELTLSADGLTRQQALEGVLQDSGISVEFAYQSLASTRLSGKRTGSREEIVGWLLSGTSHIVIHDGATGKPARILVTGARNGSPSLQFLSVPSKKTHVLASTISTSFTETDEDLEASRIRRAKARDMLLNRMKDSSEAVSRRLASLPPGKHIIRYQAVKLTAGTIPGQTGNVPLLIGVQLEP